MQGIIDLYIIGLGHMALGMEHAKAQGAIIG